MVLPEPRDDPDLVRVVKRVGGSADLLDLFAILDLCTPKIIALLGFAASDADDFAQYIIAYANEHQVDVSAEDATKLAPILEICIALTEDRRTSAEATPDLISAVTVIGGSDRLLLILPRVGLCSPRAIAHLPFTAEQFEDYLAVAAVGEGIRFLDDDRCIVPRLLTLCRLITHSGA